MPYPSLPMFKDTDDPKQENARLRDYLARVRDTVEGTEDSFTSPIDLCNVWGIIPPPTGNLIIDPSFEYNRDAWLLPIGARVEEVSTVFGDYAVRLDTAEGYVTDTSVVANHGLHTPVIPGQILIFNVQVSQVGASTGNAYCTIQFYDAKKAIVSTVNGTAVAIGAGGILSPFVKALVPSTNPTVEYARFGFAVGTLSTAARFDGAIGLRVLQHNEFFADDAVLDFNDAAEHIIGTVPPAGTMGPLVQSPGSRSIQTPVMVQANCAYVSDGNTIDFRIRRTNAAGAILNTMPLQAAGAGTAACIYMMGFDATPTVAGETWVFTMQASTVAGGTVSNRRMWAYQAYF